jgi:3D (Asp-Asp-Asp) domain-containing protein
MPTEADFAQAQSAYLRQLNRPMNRLARILATLLHRCWGGLVLLTATAFLTIGLCASEGRWITVEATAYCPCALCCDERTERTANGTDTNREPYGVASSPDLPLGTTLLIPVGIGYLDKTYPHESQRLFVVDDRGGALRTEWKRYGITRLDLRYKSHDYAMRFGRRTIAVQIFD